VRCKTRVFVNPTIKSGQVYTAGKLEYYDLETESWNPLSGGNIQIYIKRIPNGLVQVQAFYKGDVMFEPCKSQMYTLRVSSSLPVRKFSQTI
jgi:hypothetical protein